MHWIVQQNLINRDTVERLTHAIRASGHTVSLVTLIPFYHELEEEPSIPNGPVFVYGSTGLGVVAKNKEWTPGYLDDHLSYRTMLEHYGSKALNHDAIVNSLDGIDVPWENFFIRPDQDNKSFSGCVMSKSELAAFKRNVLAINNDPDATLHLEDMVIASPLRKIHEEYRCFVVQQHVVASSMYKKNDLFYSSPCVPQEIVEFAQEMAKKWSPNPAYVMDIAVSPDGLHVLEWNSANSAGFYECDVHAIVQAVNELS